MYRRIETIPAGDTILLRWHVMVVMFGGFDVKSMARLRYVLLSFAVVVIQRFCATDDELSSQSRVNETERD